MKPRLRTGLLIGAASLALGIGATAAMAGADPVSPRWLDQASVDPCLPGRPCTAPALAGAVVDVTVSDMGGMMGPGMNGGPMMGPGMMGPGMMGPG